MQFRTDEQLRKYLTKKVQYDIGGRGWTFSGIRFHTIAGYFTREFYTYVAYFCDFKNLHVRLSRTYEGLSGDNGFIAENQFSGANAIAECTAWVVNKLMEIYKLLNERTAPYAMSKDLYQQALNQPIRLQEG